MSKAKKVTKVIGGAVLGLGIIGGAYAIADRPELITNWFDNDKPIETQVTTEAAPGTPAPQAEASGAVMTAEGQTGGKSSAEN